MFWVLEDLYTYKNLVYLLDSGYVMMNSVYYNVCVCMCMHTWSVMHIVFISVFMECVVYCLCNVESVYTMVSDVL